MSMDDPPSFKKEYFMGERDMTRAISGGSMASCHVLINRDNGWMVV